VLSDDGSCGKAELIGEGRIPRVAPPAPPGLPVVVGGAGGRMGRAVVRAVSAAPGLRLAGAVDTDPRYSGVDAGTLAGLAEPLSIPVTPDLTMALAGVAHARLDGVYVDFTGMPEAVPEMVRHAVGFGQNVVVGTRGLQADHIAALRVFCEKSSVGGALLPHCSVGVALMQQAATAAAFHLSDHVVVEEGVLRRDGDPGVVNGLGAETLAVASALDDLGLVFNGFRGAASEGDGMGAQSERKGRSRIAGEGDVMGLTAAGTGVRLTASGLPSPAVARVKVTLANALGERVTIECETPDEDAAAQGVVLAIRKVLGITSLVDGLDKLL